MGVVGRHKGLVEPGPVSWGQCHRQLALGWMSFPLGQGAHLWWEKLVPESRQGQRCLLLSLLGELHSVKLCEALTGLMWWAFTKSGEHPWRGGRSPERGQEPGSLRNPGRPARALPGEQDTSKPACLSAPSTPWRKEGQFRVWQRLLLRPPTMPLTEGPKCKPLHSLSRVILSS